MEANQIPNRWMPPRLCQLGGVRDSEKPYSKFETTTFGPAS